MKGKKFLVLCALGAICAAMGVYYFAGGDRGVQVDSGYRPVMGTVARIVAVAGDEAGAQKSIEAGFEQLEFVDALMSDYKSDSEISEVNRRGFFEAVKVSEATFEVLEEAREFSRLTEGAFDVTVGPLVELWRRAGEANSVPDEAHLAQARGRTGYEKLMLDANEMSVRFAVEGMRLDLGAIAKGYAIDKAVEAMKGCGAEGGMVDIGGDIRCFGAAAGKKFWRIAMQNPEEPVDETLGFLGAVTSEYLLILKLKEQAVATSGDYRRFELIEGEKYSHIIDSSSGFSSGDLSSVTIISDSATEADALATAVTVMGVDEGLALIEKMPGVEAILVSGGPEFKIIQTSGAEKFIEVD